MAPMSTAAGAPAEWTVIDKSATETVNNSDVLQSDDEFLFTAAANTDYLVEMTLILATGTVPDWKFSWTLVGMTYSFLVGDGLGTNALVTPWMKEAQATATGVTVTVAAAITAGVWRATFVIHSGVTGGTCNFQWAQGTTTASDTSVLKNSQMKYKSLGAT